MMEGEQGNMRFRYPISARVQLNNIPTLPAPPHQIELMEKILIPVAEQHSLPIAIKIGAHRQLNPELGQGGDGMVTADITDLARMLKRYPKVKFLATFLSKTNQHEAIVLANKFRNLHIYGCWWYCNNPSIIKEVTTMRLEMLGFAFTAQHSDSVSGPELSQMESSGVVWRGVV
jgi:hypothetical protein|mmetsp:Transcript_37329/g.101056  ORF Transcript_37329/g.101056 Transcript_37329/m.101056 type:complete len:174 (-) Transcript_37329:93-614(-)